MTMKKPTWADVGKKAKEALDRTTVAVGETAAKTSKLLVQSAEDAQRVAIEATRTAKGRVDDLTKPLPIKALKNLVGNQSLYAVLDQMARAELTGLYTGPLGMTSQKDEDTADNASDDGLRNYIASELLSAAKNSLMLWQALPSYDDVVRQVAQRIDVSNATQADVADVERAILFKIVDLSINKMTEEQKQTLTRQVETELAAGRIQRKVMIDEIKQFALSMGKSACKAQELAGGAGLAGTVMDVNALQLMVLNGIADTSGYMAAGQAWLGIGFWGSLVELLEEPELIVLILGPKAVNAIAGPAFRKLTPAICVIAAKRIEITVNQQA